jgi:hypothetical protein
MTKYLISFPGSAMDISDEEMAAVGEAAHAVIREAKDAGVYVFGGGINEDVAPLMVAADGTVTNETYPQTKEFDGGRRPMGREDRQSLLLLAGTPRVRVRPRELTVVRTALLLFGYAAAYFRLKP